MPTVCRSPRVQFLACDLACLVCTVQMKISFTISIACKVSPLFTEAAEAEQSNRNGSGGGPNPATHRQAAGPIWAA